ncbi:MAG: cysteine--tRNA ligase [Patescibacteria group bacterium]
MNIKFYNTRSRATETFSPINPDAVRMYHCGPTVYDYAHIGNLRSYVFADVLRRTLECAGLRVTQVINITDVGHLTSDADEGEDKLEAGARREHKSAREIALFYTHAFLQDLAHLRIKTDGTIFPKATDHIPEQIALIQALEKNGFTYITSDGVYFDTARFPAYAEFARLDLSGMREGARIEKNLEKRNPTDFALWKFSPKDGKREQEWDSPWGVGFPGWHIECSAMSMKYLGEQFDIHTGGIDHIPVHHTNEVAQSECATGKSPFVNIWLHNAFVNVDGKRMAKSAGTFITLAEIVERGFSPLAYRYFLLTAHYRTPVNFTWEGLAGAQVALSRISIMISEWPDGGKICMPCDEKFRAAIADDLNTSEALAVVWKLISRDDVSPADKKATLLAWDEVLGLGLASARLPEIPSRVRELAEERAEARNANDFTRADEIRAEIESLGFEVRDTDIGPKITKK